MSAVPKARLIVLAPAFNEADVIERFYESTRAVLDGLAGRWEATLLFVVDRSTDDTLAILARLAERDPALRVVALSSRFGHQMSLLAGIDAAVDADAIIMMDSDLQHPPEMIPVLLDRYEAGNDVVHTVRVETAGGSASRRAAGNLFYRVMSFLSDTRITPNVADFRLISQRVATVVREGVRERNLFLRGIFSWVGFQQCYVEYSAAERAAGSSKYSLSRMMRLALTGILSFSTRPLQLSIYVGMGMALVGFLIGIIAIIEYFAAADVPSGFTTLVTLLVMFSGVQLVFMGILGIYVGAIYEEVKGRPHYVVERRINFPAGAPGHAVRTRFS
jgi:glycosyltransferase involved in cell wall biosynthesis